MLEISRITNKIEHAWFMPGMFFFILVLSGCSGVPLQTDALLEQIPPDYRQPVELSSVPFYPQQEYQCGPAALATVFNHYGIEASQEELIPQVFIPEREGSLQIEIVATTRKYGLVPYILHPRMTSLLDEIMAGHPVLVLQNLSIEWYPSWHYAVVIGYNLPNKKLILRSGEIKRYEMSIHTFERTWRRAGYWGMVALPPERLPASADAHRYMQAVVDFERLGQHAFANRAYQTAQLRWPADRNLHMGLANSYLNMGDASSAESHYRQILKVSANFAPAMNNLAEALAQQGKYQEAVNYAERAVATGGRYRDVYAATLDEIKRRQNKANNK
jgi:tetratricopeptide (TPR) repeat protein